MRKNKLIHLVLFFSLCGNLYAQPSLLKEIPSNSKNFISANGRLYFTSGDSLFRSDGTTAGTVFVAETGEPFKQLYHLTVGSFFYFTTTQSDGKTALWKSNGYANNTFKIKSANIIKPLLTYNVSLYFGMDDGISGYELHRVTSANVFTLVADINPGTGSALGNEIIIYNSFLYFNAYDPVNGVNIWKSNGTSVTHKAVDLPSGYSFSNLAVAGSNMYYVLSGQSGYTITSSLWKSNGTTAGSSLVKEFSGEEGCNLYNTSLIYYNNTLYFNHIDGCGIRVDNLYKSDGTEAGTVFIKTLNLDGYTTDFFIANNKIGYYRASQGFPGALGSSDGTTAGTQNKHWFAQEPPRRFAVVGDLLFFSDHTERDLGAGPPSDINKYYQLYQSDLGTSTTTLKDLFNVSFIGSNNLTEANGKLFFTTYNDHSSVPLANRVMKLYYYTPAAPLKQATSTIGAEYEFEVFPNPSQENFHFNIKSRSNSKATADIYKIDGTLVKRVFENETKEGASIEFQWNAIEQTGGIYFCKFTCGEETVIKRIILNK